ncbi:hypothetical protein IIU_06081 [Bacillus cereus VD133]|uniref:Uncharacterized protein n=1 Tax=Bacillus cereus VD133 TaxID=1053233 RepID=A0A9W5PKW2_BACCE|nr:hypothetical protein IIU_06081 [Bacillus cereus VD133]
MAKKITSSFILIFMMCLIPNYMQDMSNLVNDSIERIS